MTIDIPTLVAEAGGEVVGKVRLQKVMYLLDQLGLDSGFDYEYHHFGPYSSELAEKVEDNVIFGQLEAQERRRQSDGVPYIAFRVRSLGDGDPIDRHLPLDKIRQYLGEMQRRSATVLELAATIHWLAEVEGVSDWQRELVRRKGAKTAAGRDQKAVELLRDLGLPPATPVVAYDAGVRA